MQNPDTVAALERCADLLEAQHANPHRVRAYRTAAYCAGPQARTHARLGHHLSIAQRRPLVGAGAAAFRHALDHQWPLRRRLCRELVRRKQRWRDAAGRGRRLGMDIG